MPDSPHRNAQENISEIPGVPTGSTRPNRSAHTVAVYCGDLVLTGWAIKDDTVLVMAGGLPHPIEVLLNDERIMVEDIHETTRGIDGWEPLSALQLPEGTLKVGSEAFPPGIEPPQTPGLPATYAFWCRVFPRIRGC